MTLVSDSFRVGKLIANYPWVAVDCFKVCTPSTTWSLVLLTWPKSPIDHWRLWSERMVGQSLVRPWSLVTSCRPISMWPGIMEPNSSRAKSTRCLSWWYYSVEWSSCDWSAEKLYAETKIKPRGRKASRNLTWAQQKVIQKSCCR